MIAPVPLASKRLTERGYNQAWQIARPLARALHVHSDATLLNRVIHTAPQSRLDLDARRPERGPRVQGRRVRARAARRHRRRCMTTGATLEALARTLKLPARGGSTNFVALRTPKN